MGVECLYRIVAEVAVAGGGIALHQVREFRAGSCVALGGVDLHQIPQGLLEEPVLVTFFGETSGLVYEAAALPLIPQLQRFHATVDQLANVSAAEI